ncbi:hypothetical protein N8198_01870 [Gammaproteobacteria bacterium]|nr:hypothetical protein [Gammaproteobacteria bacterium]
MKWRERSSNDKIGMSMSKLLVLLLTTQLTAACVNIVSIDAEDSVEFANIEASAPLSDDDDKRIRFRGASTTGEFSQFVAGDKRIEIDDERLGGPVDVDGEIDLDYFSIAIGWDRFHNGASPGTLRSSYYFGLAQTNFDLALEGAGKRLRASDDTVELYFQVGLHHAHSASLDIGFSWAVSLGRELSGISEIDLQVEYEFYRQLRLSGGYRWFEYSYGLGDDESHLEVDFRGPFLGLNLPF